MKNLEISKKIVAAAVCGLFVGANTVAKAAPGDGHQAYKEDAGDAGKHACKGANACKGKGGCKTDANACAGKNDCKGKGGCATVKHDCKGKNDCKGQGAGAKNECKGKGDCKVGK